MSEDFRLNVSEHELAAKGDDDSMISVPLPKPVTFTIRPLLLSTMEQFTFQVIFYANLIPIPSVIKDFMAETVYASPSQKPTSIEQRDNTIYTTHTLQYELGNNAVVHSHI